MGIKRMPLEGWKTLIIVVCALVLAAVGAGFFFPTWYTLPRNVLRKISYAPESQSPWSGFSCGTGAASVGGGQTAAPAGSTTGSGSGFSATLTGINTTVLKDYVELSDVRKNVIDPYKSLVDAQFEDNLCWANSCNRLGHSVLGPVVNQSSCGSCWAFSVVTVLSAKMAMASSTKNWVAQSPQYIINLVGSPCTKGYSFRGGMLKAGSNGVLLDSACVYMNSVETYCTDVDGKETTPSNSNTVISPNNINSFHIDTRSLKNFTEDLKKILQIHGPVAASIDDTLFAPDEFNAASDFTTFGLPMGYGYNHEIVIIGYGKTNDQSYWLIRNSWGEYWGMGGYTAVGMYDDGGEQLAAIFGEICGVISVTPNTSVFDQNAETAETAQFT